jgi:hypothetical protein
MNDVDVTALGADASGVNSAAISIPATARRNKKADLT